MPTLVISLASIKAVFELFKTYQMSESWAKFAVMSKYFDRFDGLAKGSPAPNRPAIVKSENKGSPSITTTAPLGKTFSAVSEAEIIVSTRLRFGTVKKELKSNQPYPDHFAPSLTS